MVTVKINENSTQAKLFLKYIKTLSFVELVESKSGKHKLIRRKAEISALTKETLDKTLKGLDLTKSSSHQDLLHKLNS